MKLVFLLAALSQVQPGSWELTVVSEMQGQKIGPVSRTQCFTEADARDPGRILGAGGGCEFFNRSESAGAHSFDLKCGGLVPLSGHGMIRQEANRFEGELDLAIEAGPNGAGPAGERLGIRSTVTGRRLGPCQPAL